MKGFFKRIIIKMKKNKIFIYYIYTVERTKVILNIKIVSRNPYLQCMILPIHSKNVRTNEKKCSVFLIFLVQILTRTDN